MKCLLYLLAFCLFVSPGFAQKPAIDTSVLGKWPAIGQALIANDGKYVAYVLANEPNGHQTLVIRERMGKWSLNILDADNVSFTQNSRAVMFSKSGDSIGIVILGKPDIDYLGNVESFKLPQGGTGNWIAYAIKGPGRELDVVNLATREKKKYSDVTAYDFNDNGTVLAIQRETSNAGLSVNSIELLSLDGGEDKTIWRGAKTAAFTFDKDGKDCAFIVLSAKTDSTEHDSIYYYRPTIGKAEYITDGSSGSLVIGAVAGLTFSKDGTKIYFTLRRQMLAKPPVDHSIAALNVWSYKDAILQSQQLSGDAPTERNSFQAVAFVADSRVLQIEDSETTVITGVENNRYLLVTQNTAIREFYDYKTPDSVCLLDLNEGKKIALGPRFNFYNLSPDEKYLFWLDSDKLNYFCYDFSKRKTVNITAKIPYDLCNPKAGNVAAYVLPFGIAGWSVKDRDLILYDEFDVWVVDPEGVRDPTNITEGLGRKLHLTFGLVGGNNRPVDLREKILLTAYDRQNKRNGFWLKMAMNVSEKFSFGNLGDYCYYIQRIGRLNNSIISYPTGFEPVKAKEAGCWLLERMNAFEFPNIYTTEDFGIYDPMTDLKPQTRYNWLRSELIKWKNFEGDTASGILYKPENFDPLKKYPVIFTYYAKRSDELNKFLWPDFTGADINIPYFVSNGYLVCVPDIYYPKDRRTGFGVIQSVESAVAVLTRNSWVDSTRMGIAGHSFGGWETNYLVTHTHRFAAACSSAGVSDQISSYGELEGLGRVREIYYEEGGQISGYGIGVTPWTNPDLYIENSPIFSLNRITTPLLMMHSPMDGSVPFEQGIEFFTGMRRAGKKVWMLEYDNEGHILMSEKNQRDYTVRMKQFFDYYLKGVAAPVWMTRGIPASRKGIDNGFEPDNSRIEP